MHKLWASANKEFLLLTRDFGGLAILFLMPLLLVITITVIQDGTFKTLKESKIPILLVDLDQGTVSKNIQENLKTSDQFEVIAQPTEEKAEALVQNGDYQLAIVIPQNLSKNLHPFGGFIKFGGEPSIGTKKSSFECKSGKALFNPIVYGCFGSSKIDLTEPISTISPAYMTATF
mgnify:CR=1 FL=1